MTQPVNPSPEPEKSNALQRMVSKLTSSPKKMTVGLMAIATAGSLGYWGIGFVVRKKLPLFLEDQIGKIIERPIDLGEVNSFSLNRIEFGKTIIPPTDDGDLIQVEAVKVGFNIFPVLFRRTLPLQATLVNPSVYLEQAQDGTWINLDFLKPDPDKDKKDPLIYLDVDLAVDQADITTVPYEQEPLKTSVAGSGRFQQQKKLLDYDFEAKIEAAIATIQGQTELETGMTDTKLLVKDLALANVANLLPNSPVMIDKGKLNAELDVDIPSFQEIKIANITGLVNLENVVGETADASIAAESELNFSGRNAKVGHAQASLGNVTAQLGGQINLDSGYDLDIKVLPFQLGSLPQSLRQQIPVAVSGEVAIQGKLQGELLAPQLTGKVNNTQTVTIQQTPFQQINADFRADLDQVVLKEVQLVPSVGGRIVASGKIETRVKQALANRESLDFAKMPWSVDFRGNLPTATLVAPYYQLPDQIAIGELVSSGQVQGTIAKPEGLIQWNIAEGQGVGGEQISGSGELIIAEQNLSFRDTAIFYGDGKIKVEGKGNLASKKWQTQLTANDLNLKPFAHQLSNKHLNFNHPLEVETAIAQFNGRLDQLDLDQIQGQADLNLDVNGGVVSVQSKLAGGNIVGQVVPENIELNPFIPGLPVATSLPSGEIEASAKVKQLWSFKQDPRLISLRSDADLNLLVDGETLTVASQIDEGQIQAQGNISQIDLQRLIPKLPLTAQIETGQFQATGEVSQLLTLGKNSNLDSFSAEVDADLTVAQGPVKAIANLKNNQWQGSVDGSNISSEMLLAHFAPSNYADLPLDDIKIQGKFSGNVQPLLRNEVNIPIQVERVQAMSGVQRLVAKGGVTLADITSNPDIANSNLDIIAKVDFPELPINQALGTVTGDNQLIADNVDLKGQAIFQGQFTGQQLLSAPMKNSNLTGDLRLLDLALNDIEFAPAMMGKVNLQPQSELALNLQGESDVIAARAEPCGAETCKFPYWPTNLELSQGENTSRPVMARGNRLGDRFRVDIENFPLTVLNVVPGKTAGIDGILTGTTSGAIDLNLNSLAAQGQVAIANPGLGYVQAEKLDASFAYDATNDIAKIQRGSLDLGQSKYRFNAALNLNSGKIAGKISIPEAYIQDALATLRWFTIEDVTHLFNIIDYAASAAVKPQQKKATVQASIARKLDQLRKINNQIQANAAAREAAGIPTELDIQGKYQGEIVLGGTIETPQADFAVAGEQWQWQPEPPYPDIVAPLGLVIEESPAIEIPKLDLVGQLNGSTVDLEKASVKVQQALFTLKGKLSLQKTDARFAIANLTVDNLSNFVNIPVDLSGEINSVGTIKGTVQQPEIEGKVAFSEGAFNGNLLPAKLAGSFDYNGRELDFNTTAPESIQVEASLPYPIIPGKSDRLKAKVNIDQEAFVFLSALSKTILAGMGEKEMLN